MSCVIAWILLIAGIIEESGPLLVAAGLFGIAAEIAACRKE